MELEQFFQLISTYGFSVVIAAYLIYYITKKLNSKFDKLTEAIESLTDAILQAIHSNQEILRQVKDMQAKLDEIEKELYIAKR